LPVASSLAPARRWLLHSGIQERSGGFARFYDAQTGKNRAVSTEISGYGASALVWLFKITGDEACLASARKTARFLIDAWDERLRTFPFELPPPSAESDHHSYFFDCGIIIRGLIAVWRETRDEQLLEIASRAAHGMIADFHAGRDYHPILALPGKTPLPRTGQWSRAPGCYQLKAAMAWRDVAEITGDSALRDGYLEMLNFALATHSSFLPGDSCEHRVMDRLHPYCYFLEGLLPMLERRECVDVYLHGISCISKLLQEIAPTFVRSDVYAQLLRARLYGAAVMPVDTAAAAGEAEALAASQAVNDNPRIDGGFFFGRRDGRMSPHVNPASTVFALQALEMWRQFQADSESPGKNKPPCLRMLI
jgi:hypothetical protein